jgi:hypothetical protein
METTGSIALQLGLDRDLVTYLIRKGNIKPIGRAGITRVFSGEAIKQVAKLAVQHHYRVKRNGVWAAEQPTAEPGGPADEA